MISDRSEIVFFDVETTIPTRPGQAYALLEFGAILVCPRKLVELESYSNLVRPRDLSLITPKSVLCNGITKEDVVSAPSFSEIADKVYEILHGRIWAGHNILRFDCTRIQEAFAEINRPPPEPKGTIDSLVLLTQRFGRRAGNMKMATLAAYFGLGQQSHRSLDDVRMNLEVLKYCATVLFLESSLPDIYPENSWVSPNATTRSRSNEKASPYGIDVNSTSPSSVEILHAQMTIHTNQKEVANHPILSLLTPNTKDQVVHHVESNIVCPDPFDMGQLNEEVWRECLQSDETMEEELGSKPPETLTAAEREGSSGHTNFLETDEVHIPSISVSLTPFYPGTQRIHISHKDTTLQLCCTRLKVRFGISTKFVDYAGRPRLSFVVDSPANLCQVLDGCDTLAQRLSLDTGSSSEWRPVLTRKSGFFNAPTLRLNIPTVADGNITRWVTEIYEKGSSTAPHRLVVFSRFDPAELDALITPGSFVDAFFSLDTYDYQQSAGIRLVAKKLILHSN